MPADAGEAGEVARLHVGVVCDYGRTLRPVGGIGVFTYNLVEGLLALSPAIRVTLLVHEGDVAGIEHLLRRWGPRVAVVPDPDARASGFAAPAGALGASLAAAHARIEAFQGGFVGEAKREAVRRLRALTGRRPGEAGARRAARLAAAVGLAAALGPIAWAGAVAYQLAFAFLLPALAFPLRAAAWIAERGADAALSTAVGCDVWLVPHFATDIRLHGPQVVVVFDLVYRHVADEFPPERQALLERLLAARAAEADRIYCASELVRDRDLPDVLPYAKERVRVFPLAAPADLGDDGAEDAPAAAPVPSAQPANGAPFLFYPADIRPHKNHAALIRALALLRGRPEYADLELVCTGEEAPSSELRALASEAGVAGAVRWLGIVPRATIAALYRRASAVVLPSLHEGYGFPLIEALGAGAPVACAEIPAFREILGADTESVPTFDPRDPRAIADEVTAMLASRAEALARQRALWGRIGGRTWRDVARDFVRLFEEARGRGAAGPSLAGTGHG